MHEVALVSDALSVAIAAAERAGARKIARLSFALAPGGHVTRESVELLVEVLGRGTPVEGAAVVFEPSAPSSHQELALVSIDVESATAVDAAVD
jgi:Zn finger protein HypA/HybF involved in hydrogenase expression